MRRVRSIVRQMLVEEEDAEGVLKMNSRILDTSELKKLDKQEKYAVQELHNTEKGKDMVDESHLRHINHTLYTS